MQMEEPIFQRLFEAAEVANFSKAERERYEQSLKSYRDLQNVLSFTEMKALEAGAQQGFERGMQQGMEQGMQQGMEQGIQQGMEQGMQQGMEQGVKQGEVIGKKEQAIQIARNALANGLSVELVATLTGLSEDEIRTLIS